MLPSLADIRTSAARPPRTKRPDLFSLTVNCELSTRVRLPEIEPHVKFPFKQPRAAIGVPQVFSGITARAHLQTHGPVLEGSSELHHALPVGMIEALGDSQDRRKSPRHAFVRVAQRRIGGVMPRGLRLSIVIANQRR